MMFVVNESRSQESPRLHQASSHDWTTRGKVMGVHWTQRSALLWSTPFQHEHQGCSGGAGSELAFGYLRLSTLNWHNNKRLLFHFLWKRPLSLLLRFLVIFHNFYFVYFQGFLPFDVAQRHLACERHLRVQGKESLHAGIYFLLPLPERLQSRFHLSSWSSVIPPPLLRTVVPQWGTQFDRLRGGLKVAAQRRPQVGNPGSYQSDLQGRPYHWFGKTLQSFATQMDPPWRHLWSGRCVVGPMRRANIDWFSIKILAIAVSSVNLKWKPEVTSSDRFYWSTRDLRCKLV